MSRLDDWTESGGREDSMLSEEVPRELAGPGEAFDN